MKFNMRDGDTLKLPEGWVVKRWESILEIRSGRNQKAVLNPDGKYPILGSAGKVMGYADNFLCEEGTTIIGRKGTIDNPLYIESKFWNVDTAFGLIAKENLDKRFLYYFCRSFNFKNLDKGTTLPSLVKKDLVNILIPLPPLPEQKKIVTLLDKTFTAIDQAKANAEQNLINAKEMFESYLQGVFEEKGEDWEERTLEQICTKIFAGGDKPKGNFSKEKNEKYNIPIFANAVKKRGLYGYTDNARVTEPSVTIAARGSGTGHTELRKVSFYPIVRLIVLIPNIKLINLEFLKHSIDNLEILRSGSAIPQLTVPMIKQYKTSLPPIKQQKQIVKKLSTLQTHTKKLETHYRQKTTDLEELKKSILQRAFSGKLIKKQ